jgi:hypothetical protein
MGYNPPRVPLAPTNPHWTRVVGYGPFSLYVIHKEGLCPSSGDINRLMMMMKGFISRLYLSSKELDFLEILQDNNKQKQVKSLLLFVATIPYAATIYHYSWTGTGQSGFESGPIWVYK